MQIKPIFDADEGFANWTRTDLDMVMEKFDRAVRENEKDLTQPQ